MDKVLWFTFLSGQLIVQLTSLTKAQIQYPKISQQPNTLGSPGYPNGYAQAVAQPQQPPYPHFPQRENYPKSPYHYTPGYVPNSDPEHTKEMHVVYDQQNLPYVATAANETGRIGGDRTVEPWEYPYVVQFRNSSTQICGGVLVISPSTGRQLVLTAGHCIFMDGGAHEPASLRSMQSHYLRAGSVYLHGEQGQRVKIKKFVLHPEAWKKNFTELYANDIAIVFLESEFQLNWHVNPIQLPVQGQLLLADNVKAIGWGFGRDGNMSMPSKLLKVVDLPILDHKMCQKLYDGEHGGLTGEKRITERHFCAGFMQGGIDTCYGDSGGPILAIENNRPYLAGLVNSGKGCARARYPGIYAKVSSYIEWICRESYNYQVLGKL